MARRDEHSLASRGNNLTSPLKENAARLVADNAESGSRLEACPEGVRTHSCASMASLTVAAPLARRRSVGSDMPPASEASEGHGSTPVLPATASAEMA